MKYIKYIPNEMKEIKEYEELNKVANATFFNTKTEMKQVSNNHYLSTLDEYGCSRYEKIMDINDAEELSLEARRLLIISKANNTLPYTIYNLRNKIASLLGNYDFSLTMNHDLYKLSIILQVRNYEKLEYVKENIEGIIPCNIILSLIGFLNTYKTFKDKSLTYADMNNYSHKELKYHYFE